MRREFFRSSDQNVKTCCQLNHSTLTLLFLLLFILDTLLSRKTKVLNHTVSTQVGPFDARYFNQVFHMISHPHLVVPLHTYSHTQSALTWVALFHGRPLPISFSALAMDLNTPLTVMLFVVLLLFHWPLLIAMLRRTTRSFFPPGLKLTFVLEEKDGGTRLTTTRNYR